MLNSMCLIKCRNWSLRSLFIKVTIRDATVCFVVHAIYIVHWRSYCFSKTLLKNNRFCNLLVWLLHQNKRSIRIEEIGVLFILLICTLNVNFELIIQIFKYFKLYKKRGRALSGGTASPMLSGSLGGGWSWALYEKALVPKLIADALQPFSLLEQYQETLPSAFCFW